MHRSPAARFAGTLRIFAADILPGVEKVIIMDTGDVVLLDDITNLWDHFDKFDHNDLFGEFAAACTGL
jgi:hypothetical protein